MFHYIKGRKDFAKLLQKEKNLLLNTLVKGYVHLQKAGGKTDLS